MSEHDPINWDELDAETQHELVSLAEKLGEDTERSGGRTASRREFLGAITAAGLGGSLLSQGADRAFEDFVNPASAGTQSVAQLGEAGEPFDIVAEDIYGPGGEGSGDAVNFESVSTNEALVGWHGVNAAQIEDDLKALKHIDPAQSAGPTGTTVSLTDTNRINITSESDASSAADSGSGTESDPYVISGKRLDNSEGASGAGIEWDDPDATYHLKIKDCEVSGYDFSIIRSDNSSSLTVENCLLYGGGGSSPNLINQQGGDLFVKNTEFAGTSNIGVLARGALTSLRDCEFTNSKESWASGTVGIRVVETDTVNARHVEMTAPNLETGIEFRSGAEIDFRHLSIQNTAADGIIQDSNSGQISGKIQSFSITDNGGSNILLRSVNGLRIEWGEALDSADGSRSVFFKGDSASDPIEDITVRNVHVRDGNGTGGVGNELLQAWNATGITFEDCWASEASEDAFEFVSCGSGEMKRVGGVVTGQIVDVFESDDVQNGTIIVEDVVGESSDDVGVRITDVNNVRVRGLLAVRAPGPAVVVEQRNLAAGSTPNNVKLDAALPPDEDVGTDLSIVNNVSGTLANDRIGIDGDLGSNNTATYYQDGLQRGVDIEANASRVD